MDGDLGGDIIRRGSDGGCNCQLILRNDVTPGPVDSEGEITRFRIIGVGAMWL